MHVSKIKNKRLELLKKSLAPYGIRLYIAPALAFVENFETAFIQKIAATVRFTEISVCQLPNICVQQSLGKGVGLYNQLNLHRTDHMRNKKTIHC